MITLTLQKNRMNNDEHIPPPQKIMTVQIVANYHACDPGLYIMEYNGIHFEEHLIPVAFFQFLYLQGQDVYIYIHIYINTHIILFSFYLG